MIGTYPQGDSLKPYIAERELLGTEVLRPPKQQSIGTLIEIEVMTMTLDPRAEHYSCSYAEMRSKLADIFFMFS